MARSSRASVLRKHVSGDVLDVGCVQHDMEKVSEETWLHRQINGFDDVDEVVGIDILENEIEKLRKKGYDVRTQNAENINFDRKFDTIVAGELIEHLSNPGMFFKKSAEHLRPGGELVITTPNTFNILRYLYFVKNGYVPCNPEHTGWYDPKTLKQLSERYDLELESVQKYTFKDELEFVDRISSIIRSVTPADWTAETMVAILKKRD